MQPIVVDPASASLETRSAVIYTRRKARNKRFPQGCVTLKQCEADAIAAADAARDLYAAVVYGPSKSSEGTHIFYLVRWLT